MTEPATAEIRQLLDEEALRDWIAEQRWFASKRRAITGVEIVEGVAAARRPGAVPGARANALRDGHARALPAPARARSGRRGVRGGGPQSSPRATTGSSTTRSPTASEQLELLRRIDDGLQIETETGRFSFHVAGAPANLREDATARAVGAEQSNSSIVFDDRLVLKVFRKLEPGINPELEMLRFLTKQGFPNIAPLQGWYEYEGDALASTLGVSQAFLADARDGWEMALDLLESDPDELLTRLAALGAVTAELHDVLASDAGDPAFSPEQPSQESLSLLTATVDEDIERIFVNLPDDERLAPIVGRGQDVRERLTTRAQLGEGGRAIRIHGDYHLGQTLYRPSGWVIIDFEGEPARPLPERRRKSSPLRDVASMLRSFAYVTSAVEILRGRQAPPDFEQRARESFLGEYLATVDRALLPPGEAADREPAVDLRAREGDL